MAATSPKRSGVSTVQDINNIPKFMAAIPEILEEIAEDVGKHLNDCIHNRLENQDDPSWQPLAASTIRRKGSAKAWIDKEELRDLIIHTVEGTAPVMVQVGIFNHEKAFIAYCLEFGTNGGSIVAGGMIHTWNHIPERSLFRTVFNEEKQACINRITSRWNKEIEKYFVS